MLWTCTLPIPHIQPFGWLRKLCSRAKAVVIYVYNENRDTSGHLRLDLVIRPGFAFRDVFVYNCVMSNYVVCVWEYTCSFVSKFKPVCTASVFN